METVPYIVFEAEMARMERIVKRLWALLLIVVLLLVATNVAWIEYEKQFEDVGTTEIEAQADDGGNAIINGAGEVTINGKSASEENNRP